MKFTQLFFGMLFLAASPLCAEMSPQEVCAKVQEAWGKTRSYQCGYRAVTRYEGKKTETKMRYSYEKPGKVRMDIESPKKGALVIYNPEILDKVRVRPFPSIKSMVMTYELSHKRVTSDSGRTIAQSHLGEKVDDLCEALSKEKDVTLKLSDGSDKEVMVKKQDEGKTRIRRYVLDENWMIRKIETANEQGEVLNLLEWTDLKVNPELPGNLFTELKK